MLLNNSKPHEKITIAYRNNAGHQTICFANFTENFTHLIASIKKGIVDLMINLR